MCCDKTTCCTHVENVVILIAAEVDIGLALMQTTATSNLLPGDRTHGMKF